MEIKGSVKVIGETIEVGSKGFKKRQLVVSTEEQYVQHIPMDFVQDKTGLLDGYSIGDSVTVGVNVRGNEYNDKYYVSLQGWKIEKASGEKPAPFEAAPVVLEEPSDDLPF